VAIQVSAQQDGTIEVRASGTLSRDDYARLVPEVERAITQHGKARILFDMHEFHGWTAGALWEEVKFDLHHFRDIDRLALVGERRWEAGMAAFCKPFTTAKIQYFDRSQADQARQWLRDG